MENREIIQRLQEQNETILAKLDTIEEVLKMLLVNDVLTDAEALARQEDEPAVPLTEEREQAHQHKITRLQDQIDTQKIKVQELLEIVESQKIEIQYLHKKFENAPKASDDIYRECIGKRCTIRNSKVQFYANHTKEPCLKPRYRSDKRYTIVNYEYGKFQISASKKNEQYIFWVDVKDVTIS